MRLQAQKTLRVTILLSFLLWTSLFIIMLLIEYPVQDRRFEQMINLKVDMLYQRTQAIRSWVGAHGGIYAATDDKVKPSEYLSGHPERDVETPSGRSLTLLSSPAFLRLISEEFEAKSGNRVRFVSDQPIRPGNRVDQWEREGLEALRAGVDKVTHLEKGGEQIRYRLLRPMVMREKCMSCHQVTNWKLGDVAGAISVSLDATAEYQQNQEIKHVMLSNHLIMWLVGVIGLFLAGGTWRRLLNSLERQALLDPLTGVYNRREMLNRLESSMSECSRHSQQFAVMMFDIDHFKRINDSFGHQLGDEVLKKVACTIRGELRASDVLARYGGEEFLVVCRHTDITSAQTIAERIRARIERLSIDTKRGEVRLTISGGVVCYPDYKTVDELVEAADAAMYLAKSEGRNRTIIRRR